MPAVFRSPTLRMLLLSLACGRGGAPNPAPDPDSGDQPRVRIDNRASLDMDVYAVRNDGERVRLGFVSGGEKAVFRFPATVTSGTTTIRFEARPVRRGGEPVISEIFAANTGEEIAWSIPPQ
jgi:hypothetical protein